MITEEDAADPETLSKKIYEQAILQIGKSGYEEHIRTLFGREILDYAKTLVMNLQGIHQSYIMLCKVERKIQEGRLWDNDFRQNLKCKI